MPYIRCAYCHVVQTVEPENVLPTAKSLAQYRYEMNQHEAEHDLEPDDRDETIDT